MFNKGDFHIHSTCSDGNCTPTQIISLAKKRNVDLISITDHNTTSGIDEAILAGKNLGIKVIPGVELSTKFNNTRVHILGYFKDNSYNNELLIQFLHNVKIHNSKEIRKILYKNKNINNKNNRISVEEGIDLLRFFGATVVLAHPVLLPKNDFNQIIKMNFDGIEAKYSSNSEKDTKYFLSLAKKLDLVYTAGSDFHKCNDFYRSHGLIGDVYLNNDEINMFLKKTNIKI